LSARELRVRPLSGLTEIGEGDELGPLIAAAAAPASDEIVVLSQKVVSKAEGRMRRLADVRPGGRAAELAELTGKDPALVELILAESRSVVRAEPGVLIVETRDGWICANAGIDSSNLPESGLAALLPEDADASARAIRAGIREASSASPAVVIADSFGRPWRLGQSDVAIGCAGLEPLDDWRGRRDASGTELAATRIAVADQVAAAADLVRDKDSGVPGAVISGLGHLVTDHDGPGARSQQRPADEDLFR
jgi:coenzyme F420-0:L-glutamate ligase / coenzyme F420-1:gamma-L-glutamate ligase